ncbi:MAG: hypothetical protein N4A50_15100 [Vallitalea sp.]|jgi:hypothetical protein|nr:hypothetical protein [Vallitalea sp.]
MKKVIIILIAIMVAITGCGDKKETTKTEEELRKEIRAELEAQMKEKEAEESKQVKESKQDDEQLKDKANEDNNQEKDKSNENNDKTKDTPKEKTAKNNQQQNNTVDNNDTKVENSKNNLIPETIVGKKVLEYELTKETFHVKLEGEFTGLLGTVMYDDYYGSYTLNVTNLPGMISYKYSLNDEDRIIIPPAGTYVLDKEYVKEVLSDEAIAQIDAGKTLNVDCEISEYTYFEKVESEYGTDGKVKITSYEMEKNSNDTNVEDDKHEVYLSGFENETLYSQDNSIDIDYSKYSLVIVPMQESKNLGKLKPRVVDVTETESSHEGMHKFSVFGTLYNVKLEYIKNANDTSEKPLEMLIADKIENECVLLNAIMPTDFSYITITASYQYKSGLEEISFSLDDMRDPESYKIYTVDTYSFSNEE